MSVKQMEGKLMQRDNIILTALGSLGASDASALPLTLV